MHPEHYMNFTLHRCNNLERNIISNITVRENRGMKLQRQQNYNSPQDLRNPSCTDKQNPVGPTDIIKSLSVRDKIQLRTQKRTNIPYLESNANLCSHGECRLPQVFLNKTIMLDQTLTLEITYRSTKVKKANEGIPFSLLFRLAHTSTAFIMR